MHQTVETLNHLRKQVQGIVSEKLSPAAQFRLLLLLILAILFLRRPAQFLYPAVWVEDGAFFIPEALHDGFWSIFRPISGYLILIPRCLTWISLQFPLEWYPAISTFLGVCLNLTAFFCTLWFPTVLRARTLCAIAVFAIPIIPEVYILPSYTFWMGTILLILVLLWQPQIRAKFDFWLRSLILITCGLSTPFIGFLAPLFLIRTLILRTRKEFGLFLISVAVAVAQVLTYTTQKYQPGPPALVNETFNLEFFRVLLVKFFGYYLASPAKDQLALQIALPVLAYLIFLLLLFVIKPFANLGGKVENSQILLLLYLLLPLTILASIARVPLFMPHPIYAGPRYFFLPYVTLSWILLNPPVVNRALRQIGVTLLFLAFFNASSHFTFRHDRLDWASAARAYSVDGEALFLVHYDGEISNSWYFRLRKQPVK
jgi:hypothetical protein